MSLGTKIDALYEVREQKRRIKKELDEVTEQYNELEQEIMGLLESEDITLSRGSLASASISVSDVPTVNDWDQFHQYILDNNALYMLERRAAVGPWRELYQGGTVVPGTEPFEKKKLNLRKV